jgi:hypothetical protein
VGGFDPASQCEQRPGQGQGLFLGEFASLARPLQLGAETANVHNQGNLTAVNANSPTAILDRPSITERPLWGHCSGSDGEALAERPGLPLSEFRKPKELSSCHCF